MQIWAFDREAVSHRNGLLPPTPTEPTLRSATNRAALWKNLLDLHDRRINDNVRAMRVLLVILVLVFGSLLAHAGDGPAGVTQPLPAASACDSAAADCGVAAVGQHCHTNGGCHACEPGASSPDLFVGGPISPLLSGCESQSRYEDAECIPGCRPPIL